MLQNKENIRIIETGLEGNVNRTILESIRGQLSDGKWENTPGMESYWECCETDVQSGDEVVLCVEYGSYYYTYRGTRKNKYSKMTDADILNFYANKIKALFRCEAKYYGEKKEYKWDENCETELRYFHDGVKVKDVYEAYYILKQKAKLTRRV